MHYLPCCCSDDVSEQKDIYDPVIPLISTVSAIALEEEEEEEGSLSGKNQLVEYFAGLSSPSKLKALDTLERLYNSQQAQILYSDELGDKEREFVREMVELSQSVEAENSGSLSSAEFSFLHAAVYQVLLTESQADRNGSRRHTAILHDCPADASEAFSIVDFEMLGRVHAPEIAAWLRTISVRLPGNCGRMTHLLQKVATRCRAIREVEKYTKAFEMQQIMMQYGQSFRNLRNTPAYVPVLSQAPPRMAMFQLLQPAAEGRETCYDDLVEQGTVILRQVETFGAEMRQSMQAPLWNMGTLKARPRSEEKVRIDYDGDTRRLLDVVRLSIVCDSLSMVQKGIDWVRQRDDVELVRVKSAFDPNIVFSLLTGGYRDCKLNIKHKLNGHIFEVQLHLLIFYCLKREGGHDLYKWSRQFSVNGIMSASDVLTALNRGLLEDMLEVSHQNLEGAIAAHGERAMQTMILRGILVQLAKVASDHNTLSKQSELLFELARSRSVTGASKHDFAEMLLLCADCGNFDVDSSMDMCQMAMDLVPLCDLCDSEILFLARCHIELGSLNRRKGNTHDAARHFRVGISRLQEAVDDDHPKLQSYIMKFGVVLVSMGEIKEALELFHRVQKLTSHDVQRSKANFELGGCYESLEDFNKACEYYSMTLEKRLAEYGDAHPFVANTYLPIARCKAKAGNEEEALKLLQLAKSIYTPLIADAKGGRGEKLSKSYAEVLELIDAIEKARASGQSMKIALSSSRVSEIGMAPRNGRWSQATSEARVTESMTAENWIKLSAAEYGRTRILDI